MKKQKRKSKKPVQFTAWFPVTTDGTPLVTEGSATRIMADIHRQLYCASLSAGIRQFTLVPVRKGKR